jgi:PA14 domain-containing protein/GDSL-like lipase/acylhydrolase family protein
VLIALIALSVVAAISRAALNNGQGLRAEYTAASQWSRQSHVGVASEISTRAISEAWADAPPPQFRATWTGYLVVTRPGLYTFATTSDDGSTVTIDGQRVVDNSGDHSAQTRTGRIQLVRGAHLVRIEYSQVAGEYEMSWSWAYNGSVMTPVPASVLWRRHVSPWRPLAVRIVDAVFFTALITLGLVAAWTGWRLKGREWGRVAARSVTGTVRGLAKQPPLPGRATVFRIAMLFGSFVAALLVAEIAARAIFRSVRSSGDARTFFAQRPEPVRMNNLGYRGGDVGPKSERYRIAVVGDSITWGVGLPEHERYSNLLQDALGNDYEVLNFGIPGHNMPEHLQVLDLAMAQGADFVLLQLYTNDFETGAMVRPRTRPLLPWSALDRWMLRSSIVYTMMSAQWPRVQESLGLAESYQHYMYRYLGDPQSPESRAGFGMLREFIDRARTAGVPTGTVMFPNPELMAGNYPYGYLHDRVHGVCVEKQIRCVDLRGPFLSNFTDVKDIVVSPFDGHPSARASKVAAEEILAEFRPLWQPRSIGSGHGAVRRDSRAVNLDDLPLAAALREDHREPRLGRGAIVGDPCVPPRDGRRVAGQVDSFIDLRRPRSMEFVLHGVDEISLGSDTHLRDSKQIVGDVLCIDGGVFFPIQAMLLVQRLQHLVDGTAARIDRSFDNRPWRVRRKRRLDQWRRVHGFARDLGVMAADHMPASIGTFPDAKEIFLAQRVVRIAPRRPTAHEGQIAKYPDIQMLVDLASTRPNQTRPDLAEALGPADARTVRVDDRQARRRQATVGPVVALPHGEGPRALVHRDSGDDLW